MKTKKILSLLLAVLLLALSGCSAGAGKSLSAHLVVSSELTEEDARRFAEETLSEIVTEAQEEEDPFCTWTEETELTSAVPLYDCEDSCNGYVFLAETNGTEAGYLQIDNFLGELSLFSYACEGEPTYVAMTEGTFDFADLPNGKIYFLGNFSYAMKLESGEFQFIGSTTTGSAEDIAAYYQEYLNTVERQREEYASDESAAERKSSNLASLLGKEEGLSTAASSSFSPVITSDFSSLYASRPNGTKQKVTQHCSPTAGTNIMLYFRASGESSLSSSLSSSTIFMELYYAMDTNAISSSNTVQDTGTSRSKIKSGIASFCTSRNCSPSSIGRDTSVTLDEIQDRLDSGELLLASLDDFGEKDTGHSVVFFDYNGETIILYDGWSRTKQEYEYSELEIVQFVYVGY